MIIFPKEIIIFHSLLAEAIHLFNYISLLFLVSNWTFAIIDNDVRGLWTTAQTLVTCVKNFFSVFSVKFYRLPLFFLQGLCPCLLPFRDLFQRHLRELTKTFHSWKLSNVLFIFANIFFFQFHADEQLPEEHWYVGMNQRKLLCFRRNESFTQLRWIITRIRHWLSAVVTTGSLFISIAIPPNTGLFGSRGKAFQN